MNSDLSPVPGLPPTADLLTPPESASRRLVTLILALLLIAAFFWTTQQWWVPAHGGVDQNGYLVGGKQLAETGSMALRPRSPLDGQVDPFQFVGKMWVGADLGTPNERYYPKYPVGLPLLVAMCLKLGGPQHGVTLTYLISPVGMTLGLLASFLLARMLVGSVAALFCLVAVICSPSVLQLVDSPNSHGSTFGLVAWGMFFAFSWWRKGGFCHAIAGGFLCGAAVSIRYTEGLLILPLAAAAFLRLRETQPRSARTWRQSAALLLAWAAPVAALLLYNHHEMGVWTGYDPTNESTGFTWKYFRQNWDTVLRTFYLSGLMLLFPLAIGGLVAAWWWKRGAAVLLSLWVIPGILIYTAYYWAPDANNVGYARFFLTLLPAMAPAAAGLLVWPSRSLSHGALPGATVSSAAPSPLLTHHASHPAGRVYGALLPLVLLSAGLGIANSAEPIRAEYVQRQNLRHRAARVLELCPPGSTLLSDDALLLHHLQFVGNYHFYSFEYFNLAAVARLAEHDISEPQGLDPARARYVAQRIQAYSQTELDRFRDDIALSAIAQGQHVYLLTGGHLGGAPWRHSVHSQLQLKPITQEADLFAAPPHRPSKPWKFSAQASTAPVRAEWQLAEVVGRR